MSVSHQFTKTQAENFPNQLNIGLSKSMLSEDGIANTGKQSTSSIAYINRTMDYLEAV